MTNFIIIFFAQYLHYFVVLIAGFVFFAYCPHGKKKQIALTTVLSIALALVVDKLLNQIISSPRPFVADNVVPLFAHVADNGFPSEHTLLAVVVASLIYTQNRKLGLVLMLVAMAIGIARVLADVHHVIDVIGAILIGVFAVLIGKWVVARYSVASS